MTLREDLRNFGIGLGHTVLGVGVAAGIDYIFDPTGFTTPFADIAVGSGLAGGYNIKEENTGLFAVSLIGFFGSTAPYVAEFIQNGDLAHLGLKVGYKVLEYCVGAVAGYKLGR